MKGLIKVRTVVLIVIGLFIVIFAAKGIADSPEHEANTAAAVFLEEAVVLPENEGKWVLVKGKVETVEAVYDSEFGITINSPVARRFDSTYKQIEYENENNVNSDDVWGWSEVPQVAITGKAKIGEFNIDTELLDSFKINYVYEDFDENEIAKYYTYDDGVSLYLSKSKYVNAGKTYRIDKARKYLNDKRFCYTYFDTSDEIVLIGKQVGDTLYDAGAFGIVNRDATYTLEEFKVENENPASGSILFLFIGLGLVVIAIIDMIKRKKELSAEQ